MDETKHCKSLKIFSFDTWPFINGEFYTKRHVLLCLMCYICIITVSRQTLHKMFRDQRENGQTLHFFHRIRCVVHKKIKQTNKKRSEISKHIGWSGWREDLCAPDFLISDVTRRDISYYVFCAELKADAQLQYASVQVTIYFLLTGCTHTFQHYCKLTFTVSSIWAFGSGAADSHRHCSLLR